jgi:transcriptional regulator with XRE-family HTH domain
MEAGFTQEEMADLLHMTMRGYQNYESDRVPWRTLDKIAELTNVTQEWLLRGNGDDRVELSQSPSTEALAEKVDRLASAVEELRHEILAELQSRPSSRQAAR